MAGVNGIAVAVMGAGALFAYTAIRGKSITASLQNLVQGKPFPAGQQTPITDTTGQVAGGGQVSGVAPGAPSVSGAYSHAQLVQLWESAGGSPSAAGNAACHALQESSGNPAVTSANPDGGTNVGLWQLDTKGKGAGYSIAQLQNPVINARLTVQGTANGTDWSAWATPGC